MTNKMGATISASDCLLLLRGWGESKRRVRAVLTHPAASFAVFGTIYSANETGFAVSVDEGSMVAASLIGCKCGFLDLPKGESVLGEEVESGIVAVREGFEIAVMLLRD